jgi:hypothetical protein
MQSLRGGRLYHVTGANSKTGEDVQITVEAFDEADAARKANRQDVFVSGCAPAGPDGGTWASPATRAAPTSAPAPAPAAPAAAADVTTFAEAVARHPVIQRLVRTHPKVAERVRRLNADDRDYLSDLVGEDLGISYRDSADVQRLMKNPGELK